MDEDRWLWLLIRVLIPLLVVAVIGLYIVIGLRIAGVLHPVR